MDTNVLVDLRMPPDPEREGIADAVRRGVFVAQFEATGKG